MHHDRWSRVEDLFAQALDIAADQRSAFLAAACDDAGIRNEVETLLRAHDAPGPLDSAPGLAGNAMSEDSTKRARVDIWRVRFLGSSLTASRRRRLGSAVQPNQWLNSKSPCQCTGVQH